MRISFQHLLFCFLISGCSSKKEPPEESPVKGNAESGEVHGSMNQALKLSDEDVEVYEEKAVRGDPEAAFRLYRHYEIGIRDYVMAEKWLRIAAFLGHEIAKFNLNILETEAKR